MAGLITDLSQALAPYRDTFPPQSLTATGAGDGILVSSTGSNRLNARLSVGNVTGFTSLAVKMQASTDNSTFVDIDGATFTTVTAASGVPEIITFQLPVSTTNPYIYVRAYATLVGTSVRMAVSILAQVKYDGAAGWSGSPPAND